MPDKNHCLANKAIFCTQFLSYCLMKLKEKNNGSLNGLKSRGNHAELDRNLVTVGWKM